MSLYNMINGVQQETFFILPMLGKHPDEYPRFRDCTIGKLKNSDSKKDQFNIPVKVKDFTDGEFFISVYTRVGGGNRESYEEEIKELQESKYYVEDYDDDFDSTFTTFIFNVPDEWKDDFTKIIEGNLEKVSKEYINQCKKVFPKLEDKFDSLFNDRGE